MKSVSDDEAVRDILCAIIRMAVEDYRYCSGKGYVSAGEHNKESTQGMYLVGLNIRTGDIPNLNWYLWGGGLHMTIDIGDLPIKPSSILARLEPEDWKEILKDKCPSCDPND